MNMIVDIIIILCILMAGVVGMKRGVFKQTVMTVGTILVFVLAFILKDPLADWFSLNLPFFNFKGVFDGVIVLNVILYQLLAFILILTLLLVALNILIKFASGLEKVLKFTIILGLPSKILGFIVGIIEGYVVAFVILFFLSQPAVNIDVINESKLRPIILNSTPILSNTVNSMNNTIKDIYSLKDKFGNDNDKTNFNLETLDVMLKHKIVKTSSMEKLVEKGKLNFAGIDGVISKYK